LDRNSSYCIFSEKLQQDLATHQFVSKRHRNKQIPSISRRFHGGDFGILQPDRYALWADGNARQPSQSCLYFCDKQGHVYQLPEEMDSDFATPMLINLD